MNIKEIIKKIIKNFGIKISKVKNIFRVSLITQVYRYRAEDHFSGSPKILEKKIKYKDKVLSFRYRKNSLGDREVIYQIFENLDYDISQWEQGKLLIKYHDRIIKDKLSLIIDAGANIGASAVYFLNIYKKSYLYCIEPSIENLEILKLNTKNYPNTKIFLGAISSEDGELLLEDPGQSDWGFRTRPMVEKDEGSIVVKSISPKTILADIDLNKISPLILKVDIEGGEDSLFKGDISWMDKFPLIIIELHDWLLPFQGTSKSFLKAVSMHNFDFIYKGENIFLFNKNILQSED